jgi:hypothetical protein
MRDLSNTKVIQRWEDKLGRCVAQIRQVKRTGNKFFCLVIVHPASEFLGKERPETRHTRDVRDIRMAELRHAAAYVVELAEAQQMDPKWLEELLDFIYAEMNRRLNKTLKEEE